MARCLVSAVAAQSSVVDHRVSQMRAFIPDVVEILIDLASDLLLSSSARFLVFPRAKILLESSSVCSELPVTS